MVPERGNVGQPPNYGRLHLLDDDGTHLPGWPITFTGEITSSPAIVDLDDDGSLDILVATGADSVEARDLSGVSLFNFL